MRFSVSTLVAVCLAAALAAQVPSGPQQPTFRTAINFVRVDVYPMANGKPVADLTRDDFEVLEDGVAQKVDTFEHVVVKSRAATDQPEEPRSLAESNRMAADARNRVFVLFLDTFHVTDETSSHNGGVRFPGPTTKPMPAEKKPLGAARIDKALTAFLTRSVGTTDLFALLTPDMDARALTFTRRPENIEGFLQTVWGRRYAWDNLDPEEERWAICYPPDDQFGCYTGVLEAMVLRRREAMTFQAMGDLVDRLRELRDERKAAVAVSEGWAVYRPDRYLARPLPEVAMPGCKPTIPGGQQVTVGADGKLRLGEDPRRTLNTADWHQCESSRQQLANIDDDHVFRELFDRANRANVSFYPVDPRGLAVFDAPIDAKNPGAMGGYAAPPSVIGNQAQLDQRLETLKTLATATDGRAMVTSNDIAASLQKISDDLSDYYLLGYYSTNAKPDGKFRKISVSVKRPGVSVRARRGYLAATEAEVTARAKAERAADPDNAMRESALAAVDAVRPDRPVRAAAGYARDANGQPIVWVAGELDTATAKQEPWSGGADATITINEAGGPTLLSGQAAVPAATPRFFLRIPNATLAPTEYLARVRVKAKSGAGSEWVEVVPFTVPEASKALLADRALLFRRGPFTGPGFQPTADPRFRKAERLRADVPLADAAAALGARLLDRKGQPLQVPVTVSAREDNALRLASCEVTLAPLAQGDYVIELTATKDAKAEKCFVAFRIVP
ncbi:MAG: VWA domain-containing protein [Bacteroidales bacterium]